MREQRSARSARLVWAIVGVAAAAACNAVVGNEDGVFVDADAAAGEAAVVSEGSVGDVSSDGPRDGTTARVGIACGSARCGTGIVCCAKLTAGGSVFFYDFTCRPACTTGEIAMSCSNAEQCADATGSPSAVCCAAHPVGGLTGVTCALPETCRHADREDPICDALRPACPAATTCVADPTLKGIRTCQP